MVAIELVYQGELHCKAVHTPSGTVLETDAPKDNMGKGESFSPTDLVATALGACMLTIMGIAARNIGVDLNGTKVTVHKEMVASPTRRIGTLAVKIDFVAPISPENQQKLEHAAMTCPVHKSMHPDVLMPIEFNWVN
ncbi:OsmC family peroxiredoxin [bacterium]|nr:OsmC family peroxiredoxin [bacterium]